MPFLASAESIKTSSGGVKKRIALADSILEVELWPYAVWLNIASISMSKNVVKAVLKMEFVFKIFCLNMSTNLQARSGEFGKISMIELYV